jgi:aquaporin NIP
MKKYLAELFGTYGLVFAGTGAIIINHISGGAITHAGIAITFGLIVMCMIYSYGEISGAHFNPAVTIAFWVAKRLPGKEVLPYVISQFTGAILASGTLKLLFMNQQSYGGTIPKGSDLQSFVLEVILTFFLMTVILNVSTGAKEKGITAGIAIGGIVALEAMFAGPICGASMNPARSLAPALVTLNFQSLWIYLTAPLIGAALAVYGCLCVQEPGCCSPVTKSEEKEVIQL